MSKVPQSLKAMPKNKRQPVVKGFRSAIQPEEFVRSIDHLNFRQARRLGGPIYKVLSQELYEEGCTMAADFFNCLVLKERKLVGLAVTRMYVKDNPELLFQLHENVKLAEKAAKLKQCGGMLACLKILYQTLMLLEGQSEEFKWLLKDLYALFLDIAERYAKKDNACNEIKAHLYCSHAMLLAKETDHYDKCVHNFNKSLELCRGANWSAGAHKDSRHYKSLHEFVAINFARIMINYAKTLMYTNPDLGMEKVLKAIVAIAEVNKPGDLNIQNQVLLCEALVQKILLLVEQKKYEEALMHIEMTDNHVDTQMGEDFMRLKCEIFLLKGRCFLHLEKFAEALMEFKKSLLISERYNLTLNRGRALLRIGEIYAKHPGGKFKAIKALEQSKLVFNKYYDPYQKRRAVYGLANILAKDIFPNLLKVIKSSNKFCNLYALRKWKYLHVAPWEMPLRVSVDLQAPTPTNGSRTDLAEQYRGMHTTDEINLTDDRSQMELGSQSDAIDIDCLLNEN